MKIVYGCELPPFSSRHGLFNKLHPAFGSEKGAAGRQWLTADAAYTIEIEPRDALLAYSERFASSPQRVDDNSLREIRDHLRPYSDRTAHEIGAKLARTILVQAATGRSGTDKIWAHPDEVYLPRSIDKDNPNWPNAAGGLSGMLWAA